MMGVKMIVVATDTNHHNHPMSAIVDWFGSDRSVNINDAKVIFVHSPMNEDGTKKWAKALSWLIDENK